MGYILNLFHIIFVASLLIVLATRLKEGNRGLKIFTFVIVSVMVMYHAMRFYQKLFTSSNECT